MTVSSQGSVTGMAVDLVNGNMFLTEDRDNKLYSVDVHQNTRRVDNIIFFFVVFSLKPFLFVLFYVL